MARQQIKDFQEYVDAYEIYDPTNMKEMSIKLYAEINNVSGVAKALNEMGYRKDGKLVAGKTAKVKLDSNDVTEMIISEVAEDDYLHSMVKKVLNRNRSGRSLLV